MTRTLIRLAALLLILGTVVAGAATRAGAASKADADKVVADLARYKTGDPSDPVNNLQALLRDIHGQADLVRHAEQGLIGLLEGDAEAEAKLQACEALGRIGSDACIPALEKMLPDPKTSHMACYGLQPNPSPKALAALRRGLEKAKGPAAVGICGVLGYRRDAEAVPLLARLTRADDPQVAEAALSALGKISGPEAANLLGAARKSVPEALRPAATDAYLQCANRLAEAGMKKPAVAIFKEVLAADLPVMYHRGALLALMRTAGDEALPYVLAAIRGNDSMMKAAAIANIPALEGEDVVDRLAAELPNQAPDIQALLLAAIADRGGPAARKVVTEAAGSDVPATRVAAIKALAVVGNASSVAPLVKAAGTGSDEEKEAAVVALRNIAGEGVDQALITAMNQAPSSLRAELIGVLHGRGTEAAVPALLDQAAGDDSEVQMAAFKALGRLAGPADLPKVVGRLVSLKGDAARPAAERAVIEVAQKAPDAAGCAAPVLAALEKADGAGVQASLLRVLSGIGGADALAAVTKALDAGQPDLRDAAVRTLAAWPDPSAVPALAGVVRKTDDQTHRVVALRGAIRLLGDTAGTSPADSMKAYKDLMAAADRPEDKKLILGGLAGVSHPDALRMATACLDDEAVRAEAALATLKIGQALIGADPEAVKAAMEKLQASAPDAKTRQQAAQVLQQIGAAKEYIRGWLLSGPYNERNNYNQTFKKAFPPEEAGAEAEWRPCPVTTRPGTPIISLSDILGGENCAAYLRTCIHVDAAANAVLELGTDDGGRAWLNGKAVHSNPTAGACQPGEHKVKIRLNQGWNTLLVKVVQQTGPWEVCARIVGPDGSPLAGLKVDPNHKD